MNLKDLTLIEFLTILIITILIFTGVFLYCSNQELSQPEQYINTGDTVVVYQYGKSHRSEDENFNWVYPNGSPEIGEAVTVEYIYGGSVYLKEYPIYYKGELRAWDVSIFMKYDDWLENEKRYSVDEIDEPVDEIPSGMVSEYEYIKLKNELDQLKSKLKEQ